MVTPAPRFASAHLPLRRARFFLGEAQAMIEVDRVKLDHYLTAAVVFRRSAYHYLETAADPASPKAYRSWFGAKQLVIKADVLLEHFRDLRNTEIHARRVPLSRHVSVSLNAVLTTSAYGEARVIRGQPWYRRSPGILWEDARATVLRPLRRWRYRLSRWAWRQRASIGERVERIRARFRKPAKVSVMEFFFDDPEGLSRPAVVLIDAYLSRWEAIVVEAETKFPLLFDA